MSGQHSDTSSPRSVFQQLPVLFVLDQLCLNGQVKFFGYGIQPVWLQARASSEMPLAENLKILSYLDDQYRVAHLVANLGRVDLHFDYSSVCLILPGLMGVWLDSWARWWNSQIQVN